MHNRSTLLAALMIAAGPLALCLTPNVHCLAAGKVQPSKAERLFALSIGPLLRDKCLGCHGKEPDKLKGGFDVRSREAMLRGGESFAGDVLVPGKADESYLYAMVRRVEADFEMPPKKSDRLNEQQIRWIRDWINGGAPWLDDRQIAAP